MLVLSRKVDEAIQIGDNITVTVIKVKGNTVRLGISAPADVRVMRGELEIEVDMGADEISLPGLSTGSEDQPVVVVETAPDQKPRVRQEPAATAKQSVSDHVDCSEALNRLRANGAATRQATNNDSEKGNRLEQADVLGSDAYEVHFLKFPASDCSVTH